MNIAWRKRMALGILGCAVVLGGASLAQEKFPSRPIEISPLSARAAAPI
jgi:hypothetical protein